MANSRDWVLLRSRCNLHSPRRFSSAEENVLGGLLLTRTFSRLQRLHVFLANAEYTAARVVSHVPELVHWATQIVVAHFAVDFVHVLNVKLFELVVSARIKLVQLLFHCFVEVGLDHLVVCNAILYFPIGLHNLTLQILVLPHDLSDIILHLSVFLEGHLNNGILVGFAQLFYVLIAQIIEIVTLLHIILEVLNHLLLDAIFELFSEPAPYKLRLLLN